MHGIIHPVEGQGIAVPASVPGHGTRIVHACAVVGVAGDVAEERRAAHLLEAQQHHRRAFFAHLRFVVQHVGVGFAPGAEAEDPLLEVGQLVVIGVHHQRVGRDPGPELAAAFAEAVHQLPAADPRAVAALMEDLLAVCQAVAVAVLAVGVGAAQDLLVVAHGVPVAVGRLGIGAPLEFESVRKAVGVGVPLPVIGVVATVRLVEQPIAVKVFHAGEGDIAALPPRQAVATIFGHGLVEAV